jgi:hypothetical protein
MDKTLSANIIVCPHCNNVFEHNKINGIALLEIVNSIDARKRMHCRLTLDSIERVLKKDSKEFELVKKAVLDGYNELARTIYTSLGFGTEVE